MKKSTIAVAALLTALSTAPVMSVAYADDTAAPTNAATDNNAGTDKASGTQDSGAQGTDAQKKAGCCAAGGDE